MALPRVRLSRRGWSVTPRRAASLLALVLLSAACDGAGQATSTPAEAPASVMPTITAEATTTATAAAAAAFSVVDSSGVELSFEAPPQRIVSHSPGATEILFAIGAGDQVVAADEFSTYPAQTEQLERVAYSNPDPEWELALDPDLVILAGQQQASVEQFRDLGLTVYFGQEPGDIEGVLETIETYGDITGHAAEAEALAAALRERLDALDDALAGVERGPRVFYELTDDLYTVAPESFIGGMLTRLKLLNVAEGSDSPFPQLTSEAIAERDPEVILLADGDAGVTPEAVAERPGWSSMTAVAEGRVYLVDPDQSSRPGPRIVDAMEEWAALIYPDRVD